MMIPRFLLLTAVTFFVALRGNAQYVEKVVFDAKDSANNYYLAVPPRSNEIKGAVVVLSNFTRLDDLAPETKLHNVAYGNDLLTVFVSLQQHLYADSAAVASLNSVMSHIVHKYNVDTAKFVLAGYDYAANIALRYTELTRQYPSRFPVQPKAVFTVSGPVDLFGLWHWCERIIRKNYPSGQLGDAGFLLDFMTKENGSIYNNAARYKTLTPFNSQDTAAGNEIYLEDVPVRLYYDTDIAWQLTERHNSLYDTYIPDATALVERLLSAGNKEAEFIAAKQPGRRINGMRHPDAFSIVDETECVQWIKSKLDIFDPVNYKPAYTLSAPKNWSIERFPFPVEFAPQIPYKGLEDVRFTPGWGDSSSAEYWTYAFLWWLQNKPVVNTAVLTSHLTAYYSGLVNRNIISRKIPAEKVVPTVVSIKKIKAAEGDRETYTGTVSMLDYMTQRPMVLNCRVHVKNFDSQQRTALFFEISPQPLQHATWKDMEQIWSDFHFE